MPKDWDDTMKRLVKENPQHFVEWILKQGEYKGTLSCELKNWTIESDFLLAVGLNSQDMLLHLEFQSKKDDTMAQRLLEYNIMATRVHKLPVYSCVIYLRKVADTEGPPLIWTTPDGTETLRFSYVVMKLWEISAEELIRARLPTLLPLLPLTEHGKQFSVVERMIDGIVAAKQPRLLIWAKAFAGLVLTDDKDHNWLERRFAMYEDILDESWVVQEWKQAGELRGQRSAISELTQIRFPELLETVNKYIYSTKDTTVLQKLLVTIGIARGTHEVKMALADLMEKKGEEKIYADDMNTNP